MIVVRKARAHRANGKGLVVMSITTRNRNTLLNVDDPEDINVFRLDGGVAYILAFVDAWDDKPDSVPGSDYCVAVVNDGDGVALDDAVLIGDGIDEAVLEATDGCDITYDYYTDRSDGETYADDLPDFDALTFVSTGREGDIYDLPDGVYAGIFNQCDE